MRILRSTRFSPRSQHYVKRNSGNYSIVYESKLQMECNKSSVFGLQCAPDMRDGHEVIYSSICALFAHFAFTCIWYLGGTGFGGVIWSIITLISNMVSVYCFLLPLYY